MSRSRRPRCYECGTRNDRSDDACHRCGAALLALCACGAHHSVYDSACPECGEAALPRAYPVGKRPLVRLLVLAPVLAALGVGIWILTRPDDAEPWELKADAQTHFEEGRFDEALKLFVEAGRLNPRDAAAPYMVAVCYSRLGYEPSVFLPHVREALNLDGEFVPALLLLGELERRQGRLDLAIGHATEAVRSPGAPGRAHRLRAELELSRPQPDLALALSELKLAKQKQDPKPGLELLIARTQLQLFGATRPGRFPPALKTALAEAARSLENLPPENADPVEKALALSQIEVALENFDKAFLLADSALSGLPADADPWLRARLLIARGRALLGTNAPDAAISDFSEALSLRPLSALAAEVAMALRARGDIDGLESLLVESAMKNDPQGEIRAVLATHFFRTGKLDEALDAVRDARTHESSNALFAELEGDILAAQKKIDEARTAYEAAAAAAPRMVSPKVRLALLPLNGDLDMEAREAAARAALVPLNELHEQYPGDPLVARAVAGVHMELAEPVKARAVLEEAVKRAPGDAEIWTLLARARRATQEDDALVRAAEAFQKAWQLRPDDVEMGLQEARAWLEAGNAARAVVACNAIVRNVPDQPEGLRLRAHANRQLGRWAAAATDLQKLHDGGATSSRVLIELVDALFRSGRDVEAAHLVRDSRRTQPTDVVESLEMIATLHQEGPDEAIAKLAARGPNTGLAEVYLRTGRTAEALEVLRILRAERPDDPNVAMMFVIALLDVERPDAPRIVEARQVAAGLPNDTMTGVREFILGRAALAEGDATEAARQLKEAAHHLPTSSVTLLFYGEALVRTGRRNDGLVILRRAASLATAPPEVGQVVARRVLQESLGAETIERAESLAREALRLDRGSLPAVRRLSDILTARGAFDEAAQLAENVLPQDGLTEDDRRAFRMQAVLCRISSGDTARALVHLDTLKREGGDPDLEAVLRGFAMVQRGDHADAEPLLRTRIGHPDVGFLACVGLVTSQIRRVDFPAAGATATAWREDHPDGPDPGLHMARELRHLHEYARAEVEARAFRSRHPAERTGLEMHMELLGRLGRSADAVREARSFVDDVDEERRDIARLLLVRALLTFGGDPDDALALCKQLGDHPAAAIRTVADALASEALLMQGEHSLARNRIDTATAGWEDDRPVTAHDRAAEGTVRFVRGTLALIDGHYAAAVTDFARCRELEPRNPAARNNLAWALAHIGDGALRGHEVAVGLTEEFAAVPDYWDTRGVAASRCGLGEDAEASFRKALTLYAAANRADAGAETHLRLVRLLDKQRRYADAADEARKLIATAPGSDAAEEAEQLLKGSD